jgi:hypothetical protein
VTISGVTKTDPVKVLVSQKSSALLTVMCWIPFPVALMSAQPEK